MPRMLNAKVTITITGKSLSQKTFARKHKHRRPVCDLLQHAMGTIVPAVSKHHNGLPCKGQVVTLACKCDMPSFIVCDGSMEQECIGCETLVYGAEGCGVLAICCTSKLPDLDDDTTHRATTKTLCR